MATFLYLVRHGETAWNREGRYQGHMDVPLAPEGLREAERLAQRLSSVPFDAIFSSDLSRCLATAEAIAALQKDARRDGVAVDRRLREMAYGRWEGLTLAEVRERYPDELAAYQRDAVGTRLEGGESFADVMARVRKFIGERIELRSGRLLVVTHGGTLKAVLFHLLGLDPRLRGRFVVENGSLTVLRLGEGVRPRLLRLNDVAHLDRPLP
ncbi:MAG: alpha-ribazole phosphatase [Clostridia bacterium]|nr:alpha-ribazole phosphatase [Clostridia bacterium]